MIKACIFDLDGTLTNSLKTIAHFLNETTKQYGISEISVEDFKLLVGNGSRKLIERVLELNNKRDAGLEEEILKKYTESYDKDPTYLCEVYEGIHKALKKLKEKNIKLAVLSNKQQIATEEVVKKLFDKDLFSFVYGAKDGVALKPNPSSALDIISKLGFKKNECLFIGDTYVDIKTGKNAEISTLGVLWGFRDRAELEVAGADRIIKTPSEILDLF